MSPGDALSSALLELGLEDLIPLWEAVTDSDVVAATDASRRQHEVAAALLALGESRQVSFYLGPWDGEVEHVSFARAAQLVVDASRYDPATEPDGQRLYYVNVRNVPDP